jgi:hypothetical protein
VSVPGELCVLPVRGLAWYLPMAKVAGSRDSACRVHRHSILTCGSLSPPGPSSKFRHAQGTVLHRDSHITNLKGLNLTTPGECDGFCANWLRVAVPLLSSGGQVAVLEVRDPHPARGAPQVPCGWQGCSELTESKLCQAAAWHIP